MKSFLRLLPLIIFPYAYIICIVLMYAVPGFIESGIGEYFPIIVIVYMVLTLISTIFGSIYAAKSKMSPCKAATLNLVVKAVQIPAYLFHFLLGLAGTVMSVWGIGIVAFAVLIDLFTIALTGIHAIGCSVKCCKGGSIGKGVAVLASIGSFIYCIDIITAIVLRVISSKYKDEYVKPQNGGRNAVQTDQSI